MPARRDDQVLFAIYLVGHRRSISGGRQYRIPNFFSILNIECPDTRVGGACYEHQAAFGGDWTAEADGAQRDGTVYATEVFIEPIGTCHRIVPFAMSTAVSVPQGGAPQGKSEGDWMSGEAFRKGFRAGLHTSILVIGADLVTRDEPSTLAGEIVGVDEGRLSLWIERVAAPVHTARFPG